MNTYDFNKPFLGIQGEETPVSLSKQLAEFIATETEGKAVKLYGWLKSLQKDGHLMLDDADKDDLKSIIENSKRATIIAKGQWLEILNKKQNETTT